VVEVSFIFRLLFSAFLGGIIGINREKYDKPAGLRTHALVSLASTLFMILSIYPFKGVAYVDVTRLGAAAIMGMGFLGAGAIWQEHKRIEGLTTAASIWCAVSVGIAVGVGYYLAAIATTGIIFILLNLKSLDKMISKKGEDGEST